MKHHIFKTINQNIRDISIDKYKIEIKYDMMEPIVNIKPL